MLILLCLIEFQNTSYYIRYESLFSLVEEVEGSDSPLSLRVVTLAPGAMPEMADSV